MSFKEGSILLLISSITRILNQSLLLVETVLDNSFTKLLDKQVKEHNATWVLKTIVLSCQTVINKMP